MEEKNWQYRLSEKGDWFRINDEENQVKPYGRNNWAPLNLGNLKESVQFIPLDDLWIHMLSRDDYKKAILAVLKEKMSENLTIEDINIRILAPDIKLQFEINSLPKNMYEDYEKGKLKEYDLITRKVHELSNGHEVGIIIESNNVDKIKEHDKYKESIEQSQQAYKDLFNDKDPSSDEEFSTLAYKAIGFRQKGGSLMGFLKPGKMSNPVEALINILTAQAEKIDKWYYWNGKLKAQFLNQCIMAINLGCANGPLSVEDALQIEVENKAFSKKANQKPLNELNAMNWHRHFFRNEKTHTKTHDNADDVCRLSLLEAIK